MNIEKRFPSVADMQAVAARKMPKFIHDYMIGGMGVENCVQRNRDALNSVLMMPHYLLDAQNPNINTELLGYQFDAPFGVAPMGLSGLMWPNLECILAGAARQHNIPYVLSIYACASLERVKVVAGENGWFQYYPSDTLSIERDLLARCATAGYKTLVLTVDTPVETRRNRDIRNGLSFPPRFDWKTGLQMMQRPQWAAQMLRFGKPEFESLKPYYPSGRSIKHSVEFISNTMKGHITAERFERIRATWDGQLIVKGILDANEAQAYVDLGANGIIVSNHGGRQFDAAPTPVDVLPIIRAKLDKDIPIMVDGGVQTGLDIARFLALGADFVFLGRSFVYAVAAMGEKGAAHVMHVLKEELMGAMAQMGCASFDKLPSFLIE